MKFRPRIQLQVRSVEQFEAMKAQAAEKSVSLNEWILGIVESAYPFLKDADTETGAQSALGNVARKPSVKRKPEAAAAACPDCGSVGSVHQRGCKRKGR